MSRRYRMYPTPAQEQVMVMHCDHARFVWNLCVDLDDFCQRYRPWRAGDDGATGRKREHWPKPQDRNTTHLRDAFPWLREGSSSVQQQEQRQYTAAIHRWFEASKTARANGTRPPRRPKHRRKRDRQGFEIRDVTIRKLNRRWAEVTVPKCGRVRFRLSRPVGECGHARVTVDNLGRWHVAFAAPQTPVDREPTGSVVGVDRGVTDTIALSDGTLDSVPGFRGNEEARKKRLQRRLDRQVNGSNRKRATRRAIAKLDARAAQRRNDWIEKTSTRLVVDHDVIVLENLRVANMIRSARGSKRRPGRNVAQKRGLNRSISRQGWAQFATRIEQKAAASGVVVVKVPAPGTSQRCSCCGEKGERRGKVFRCERCDLGLDADVNAAVNVRAAGLRYLDAEGSTVRSPCEASTSGIEAHS